MVDLRITDFFPGFLVPVEAYPSFLAGFALLFVSIYTFTIKANTAGCALIRFAFAPLAVRCFLDFGYAGYNTPGRQPAVGMATICIYGIFRVIDTTIVSLFDERPPAWINKADGKVIPMPSSVGGRLLYSFDLLTSLRGISSLPDRYWEWAPRPLTTYSPSSRLDFLKERFVTLVSSYLLVDLFDTLNKSRDWDPSNRHPITSLSVPEQIVFATSVCVGIVLALINTTALVSFVAVALGSPPACWPPMFDGNTLGPFTASSLTDFWTRRWHATFRRTFARLAVPPLALVSKLFLGQPYVHRLARLFLTFGASTLLHCFIMFRMDFHPQWHNPDGPILFDSSIIAFFMLQPIGLLAEWLVIVPVSKALFGEKGSQRVTRVWVWCFVVFTGRYWSDCWVHRGMWHPSEKVMGYSLVRGLLYGRWPID
ncbi:hypothetical protein SCHPADRAFT_915677 [Schizopora paradoxa]|uniref:Wax synthase domain-containing protein n=1 Tax=Schizopora paradoxa TaxID=27342 RepID=A0A0H2RKC2_9AGAM|nr:hypothetical protein SCHPADRAFT_915677 [Schizopora paradoxa]